MSYYSLEEVKGKGTEVSVPSEQKNMPTNMVVNGLINRWTQEDQALIWGLCAKGCSAAEFKLLLYTAAKYHLDPLMKEIWCYKVKVSEPAVIFVSRDGLRSRAQDKGLLNGLSFTEGVGDKPHFDNGEFTTKKDFFVEGTLYIKGWDHPIVHKVYYSEYCQTRWDYEKKKRMPNSMWNFETGKPVTMLKKVCEAQMYRAATNIKGIYIPEEFGEEGEGTLEDKKAYIKSLEATVSEEDFKVTEEEVKSLLEAYKGKDIYTVYKQLTAKDLPKMLGDISRNAYDTLMNNIGAEEKKEILKPKKKEKSIWDGFGETVIM